MARPKLKTDKLHVRLNEEHLAHAKKVNKTESHQVAIDIVLEFYYNNVGTLNNNVGTLNNNVGTLNNNVGTLKQENNNKAEFNVPTLKDNVPTLSECINNNVPTLPMTQDQIKRLYRNKIDSLERDFPLETKALYDEINENMELNGKDKALFLKELKI